MLSRTTVEKIKGLIEEQVQIYKQFGDPVDELLNCIESIEKDPTPENIVSTFIKLAWDLPSFEEELRALKLSAQDFKTLLGEAVYRRDEWST